MRVGSFSLMIPEGRERSSGHVVLQHGQVYTLRMGNHNYHRRCDAEVTIDSKQIGAFRIPAGGILMIERPTEDTGKFTFYSVDSEEGSQVGSPAIVQSDKGLVQVIFRPERLKVLYTPLNSILKGQPIAEQSFIQNCSHPSEQYTPRSTHRSLGAGVTGLTGQSEQQFQEVPNLDYDPNDEVTISVRLVTETPAPAPRPLVSVTRKNPVPPPVS